MRFEQETIVPGDATIGSRIDEAETKATHYMTDTTNGVKVHPDNDTANYVLIQNGMEIFRNNVSVANYGSSTRIGKSDKSHISIDNSKVSAAGYDGEYVCSFGTSNDDNTGLATVEGTYYARHISEPPGFSATGFWLDYLEAEEILDCYINEQKVSDVSDVLIYEKQGIYSDLFQVGDSVKVTFTTMSVVPVFSFGADSVASGVNSASFGNGALSKGFASFASNSSTASGNYSSSSGYGSIASGDESHAEGTRCKSKARYSHAEGNDTIASGEASHSEGSDTEANGFCSHSGGYKTIADGPYQTAIGKYNEVDDGQYVFIVGNGDDENSRSNALTVSWDGKVNGSKLGVEVITDWDTLDDDAKSRFLYGNNAANGPAAGAQIIGIELNNSENNRVQIGFRAGSGTSNSFFVRHAPNGTWGTWTEFGGSPASTSTGISGINAVKNGTGTAMLYFASFSFAANTGTDSTAYRLPVGLRPPVTLDLVSTHNNVRFFVTTDGYIRPAVATTAATAIRGTFTFLAS